MRSALGPVLVLLVLGSARAQIPAEPPSEPPGESEAAEPRMQNRSESDAQRPSSGRRGNFNPAEMQARMLEALRTQMEVKDDAEWQLINERITRVNEMRRATAAFTAMGMMRPGGPGGMGGGPNGGPGGRFGVTTSAELDALRSAVSDKATEAEIKDRLERFREARKQAEANLEKAREDLRAVLTPRQEAVAVVAGLLL